MAEATDLPLRCRCGTVRGVARDAAPSKTNHCFCYCDDCQAFVHFLGRADDIFDAHGGTEITQMSQANVGFTAGMDKIAAMRLTPYGLIRWYASCCGTPIGNTLGTSAMPFIGVIHAFIDAPSAALGPIRGRGWAKSAKGGRAAVPKDGLPMSSWSRALALPGAFSRDHGAPRCLMRRRRCSSSARDAEGEREEPGGAAPYGGEAAAGGSARAALRARRWLPPRGGAHRRRGSRESGRDARASRPESRPLNVNEAL
jgi:hypothetical protein